jgi:hypothetical protein
MSADRLDSAARERMLELLADRAIHGLSSTEQAELERMLAASGGDDESVDRAAAAAHLAFEALLGEKKAPAIPEELRARLVAGGRAVMERNRSESPRRSSSSGGWAGWVLAAAAAVVAVVGWWPKLTGSTESSPSLADQWRQVEGERDKIAASFKPGPDADGKNVSGDLVWSPRAQKGLMRFRGLPKNDATKAQYQLWIFDGKQDERYPIDGGVFDVDAASGEAIVRIDARLKVLEPKLFAVTIEKPGGVVVSGRERIVALAQM